MKLFYLQRDIDESGVSGTGIVAEGVEFSDGRVCMRWLTSTASTGFYDSIDQLELIHGHNGKTKVVIEEDYKDLYENVFYPSCENCGGF